MSTDSLDVAQLYRGHDVELYRAVEPVRGDGRGESEVKVRKGPSVETDRSGGTICWYEGLAFSSGCLLNIVTRR